MNEIIKKILMSNWLALVVGFVMAQVVGFIGLDLTTYMIGFIAGCIIGGAFLLREFYVRDMI